MKKSIVAVILVVVLLGLGFVGILIYQKAANALPATTANAQNANTFSANPTESVDDPLLRTNGEGQVTVDVVPEFKEDGSLQFAISLNTHSVDLSRYDMLNNARLLNDKGVRMEKGFTWREDEAGGHHRFGTLIVNDDGLKQFLDQSRSVILEINNLDGVPVRQFTWDKDAILQ